VVTEKITSVGYSPRSPKSTQAYVPHPKWSQDNGQQKAQELGKFFHEFMQDYDRKFNLKAVETQWVLQQKPAEIAVLSEMARLVLTHPKLKHLYGPGVTAKNECTLWLPHTTPEVSHSPRKEVLRPDRLVFGSDHRVWVLDYKTGAQKKEHEQQVAQYAQALSHMGYTLEEALIIYVQSGSINVVAVQNTLIDEHDI